MKASPLVMFMGTVSPPILARTRAVRQPQLRWHRSAPESIASRAVHCYIGRAFNEYECNAPRPPPQEEGVIE